MNGKDRITAILNGEPADRTGFWLGCPADETKAIYYEYFGVSDDLELAVTLGSDFYWVSPELDPSSWKSLGRERLFDEWAGRPRTSLSQPGVLAECEDVAEIEAFPWPDPDCLDFTSTIEAVDRAASTGMAVFGGMWVPFFHKLCNFFGMENYFVKMHTHPNVVEAVTEHVIDFYLAANRRCLEQMGAKLDAVFFGNDLGSQEDLLISPAAFEKFVLPGVEKVATQARSFGLKTVFHSCGAISRIIPMLIDAGIDALNPLQAKAAGMEAEKLGRQFRGHLTFIGGVDTQELLPFGTPEQVKSEVRRLKEVFGQRYIVSPSHETLLPNVPPENVLAMRDAATGD